MGSNYNVLTVTLLMNTTGLARCIETRIGVQPRAIRFAEASLICDPCRSLVGCVHSSLRDVYCVTHTRVWLSTHQFRVCQVSELIAM